MGIDGPLVRTLNPSSSAIELEFSIGDITVDLSIIKGSEPQVNTYPASEQRISEVERGRISNAILPMPPGKTLSAGDSIIFALAYLGAIQDQLPIFL